MFPLLLNSFIMRLNKRNLALQIIICQCMWMQPMALPKF